jgi:molybdopterin molybdotransferase
MLTVEEALAEVLSAVPLMPAERVALLDSLGRALAEDLASPRDLPPFDVSQMDGYAVRIADLADAAERSPVRLSVVTRSVAGQGADRPVGQGEAARVMTGAPLPAGADAVVMQEQTDRAGDSVSVKHRPAPREFVRSRGADLARGGIALRAGALVGPAQIALLASLGRSQVAVRQRPRVAVLSTGDELCDLDDLRLANENRIIDSNSWGLCAQILAARAVPVRLGLARDDPAEIARALHGAQRCDALVTSAGVSVGERDFVKEVLSTMGVELRFWRVAMKPGKPLAFGSLEGRPVFALPGNPTSAMVSFDQFVRPALLKMAGWRTPARPKLRARLEGTISKRPGLVHFVRARTRVGPDGQILAQPVPRQDSGLVSSMAEADSLIVVPAAAESLADGAEVAVLLLDCFAG